MSKKRYLFLTDIGSFDRLLLPRTALLLHKVHTNATYKALESHCFNTRYVQNDTKVTKLTIEIVLDSKLILVRNK